MQVKSKDGNLINLITIDDLNEFNSIKYYGGYNTFATLVCYGNNLHGFINARFYHDPVVSITGSLTYFANSNGSENKTDPAPQINVYRDGSIVIAPSVSLGMNNGDICLVQTGRDTVLTIK